MLAKIMVYVTLTVLVVGFIWFGAQVVYLGTREFFKKQKKGNK